MRSEGYSTWSVCLCVCVCVCVGTYSRTTCKKAAKNRYQWVQCHTGLIFKMAIFVNPLRSKVMAKNTSETASMLMSTASPRPAFVTPDWSVYHFLITWGVVLEFNHSSIGLLAVLGVVLGLRVNTGHATLKVCRQRTTCPLGWKGWET